MSIESFSHLHRIDVTAAVAELSPNRTKAAPNLSMVSSGLVLIWDRRVYRVFKGAF